MGGAGGIRAVRTAKAAPWRGGPWYDAAGQAGEGDHPVAPVSNVLEWVRRAVPAAALAAAAFLPGDLRAASASGTASVVITLPAGVVGLQELSNANGFLAPAEVSIADAVAPIGFSPAAAPPPSGGLAAAVSISGVPNQAFSLTLTDTLVIVTETGEVVVTSFDHNAGASPAIGGDGSARISIGASARPGNAQALQQLQTQSGAGAPEGGAGADGPGIVQVTVQTENGPQVLRVQRPDNFGPNLFGEKFFTVLVSYN